MKERTLNPLPLLDSTHLKACFQEFGVSVKNVNSVYRAFMKYGLNIDYNQIDNLPKRIVPILEERFTPISSTVTKRQKSADGTVKLLVRLQDGHDVESVVIPHFKEDQTSEVTRVTLCVSSQIGCRMNCGFCATGTLGLSGNLYAGEILEQLWHANREAGDLEITNIVFMGMGEPLENYDAVVTAIRGMTDSYLFALAPRNITVSTVGVVDKIERLIADLPAVRLAFSLHAPNQELRQKIVPTAKAWPLKSLMRAIDRYSGLAVEASGEGEMSKRARQRRVMIEYVVLKDVNDQRVHAHELGRLLQGRNVMVNLIPFNPFEGNSFQTPEEQRVQDMVDILFLYNIRAHIRHHHGRDIDAACGQLAKREKDEDEGASSPAPEHSSGECRPTQPDSAPAPVVVGLKDRTLWDKADLVLFSDPQSRLYLAGLSVLGVLGVAGFCFTKRKSLF